MSFDAQKVFQETKDGYLANLGGFQDPVSPSKRIPYTTYGDVTKFGDILLNKVGAGDFVHTAAYDKALVKLRNALPLSKFSREHVAANLVRAYPYNAEFWSAGLEFVIARRAAGMVPGTWSVIKESVSDSVRDLVAKVPSIPGVALLVSIVKWTAVAGGAFLLWQYVVQPYLAKRQRALGPGEGS